MKKYSTLEKFRLVDLILKNELTLTQAESEFGMAARTIRS